MQKQTPGQIFLADQRGIKDSSHFRRLSTFNFGEYKNPDKESFGSLYVFNEEQVAPSQNLPFTLEADSYIILIPITGALEFIDPAGNATTVDVEEMYIGQINAGHSYTIANPYKTEIISFLQLWLKAASPGQEVKSQLCGFNLEAEPNQLIELTKKSSFADNALKLPFALGIGQFDGRKEALYTLKKQQNQQFFAFIIAGAFEIEGRLLHEKDGLALWDVVEVELEALSNNALILTLELL